MEKLILSDVAEITKLAGFEFTKYVKYVDDGEIIAIRALNLKDGGLFLDDVRRISKTVSENLTRSQLRKYDIVISYTGTIGECAQIAENGKYHLAPNVAKITPKKNINPDYLFQYIRSPMFKEVMRSYCHGSTQPTIPMKTLREIPINILPIDAQEKIAGILQILDKKININKKINKNLEQQVKTKFDDLIFKLKNSNSSHKMSLADLMDYAGGSQPPASEFIFKYEEGYIRFVQIRDYETDAHITYIPISSKNKLCDEYDIMIARYGASLGRICYGLAGAYNVALAKVFPKKPYYREFLRCYLSSREFYEGINNKGGRSAQAGFNQSDIKSFKVMFPNNDSVIHNFENFAFPIFEMRLQLKRESKNLGVLRDTILPRLMSGELDVSSLAI